jgi:hypothetical protein
MRGRTTGAPFGVVYEQQWRAGVEPGAARRTVAGGLGHCHNRVWRRRTPVIRYMGTRKNAEGATVYVFIVNGMQKEIREHALKQHPGCYDALPDTTKALIAANRDWLSKAR